LLFYYRLPRSDRALGRLLVLDALLLLGAVAFTVLLRAGAEGRTVLRLEDELLLAAGLLCLVGLDDELVDRACGVARDGEGVLLTVLTGAVRVCVAGRLTAAGFLLSLLEDLTGAVRAGAGLLTAGLPDCSVRAGRAEVPVVPRCEFEGVAIVELRCVRVALLRSLEDGRALLLLTVVLLVPRSTDGRVVAEPFRCVVLPTAGRVVPFCSALEGRLLTALSISATRDGRLLLRVF